MPWLLAAPSLPLVAEGDTHRRHGEMQSVWLPANCVILPINLELPWRGMPFLLD